MQPLTDDEAALLYTVQMRGADWYPINKLQRVWTVGPWRSWKGFPTCHKTKRAAIQQFEGWVRFTLDRWADMRREHPDAILTAVGILGLNGAE